MNMKSAGDSTVRARVGGSTPQNNEISHKTCINTSRPRVTGVTLSNVNIGDITFSSILLFDIIIRLYNLNPKPNQVYNTRATNYIGTPNGSICDCSTCTSSLVDPDPPFRLAAFLLLISSKASLRSTNHSLIPSADPLWTGGGIGPGS
jgi:hypothetical protein